jgi:hypothetical protein
VAIEYTKRTLLTTANTENGVKEVSWTVSESAESTHWIQQGWPYQNGGDKIIPGDIDNLPRRIASLDGNAIRARRI